MDRRKQIIFLSVLAALIGALIPLGLSFYISGLSAVDAEQAHLMRVANHAIVRANLSLREVDTALRVVEHVDAQPCSAEHIQLMRMAVINARSVEEVGYFENGFLKCTSWGIPVHDAQQLPADFAMSNGIKITRGIRSAASTGKKMIGLNYHAHNVLVDPGRFADIITDPDIQIAVVASGGQLLGTLNRPDPGLVEKIVRSPGLKADDDMLFAAARSQTLTAVALAPRSKVLRKLRNEQLLVLLSGCLVAALMIGVVVWLLRKRLSPLGELAVAVRRKEFIVHYQPLLDLKSGICIGAEALVRWQRPDGQMVRPDSFIALAEESGLILPITDQVVAAVISDLKDLLISDRGLHIAINVCAQDIKTGRILDVLTASLTGSGIEPQQIWLEATERGFMDIDAARASLSRVRELGHAVAIDDFGTGYSSLSYLQGLQLDALKIDKSFVDTIGGDAATSSVTAHIIAMAQTLKLKIIAEGIETQLQADYLMARDVDYGQGWLFAKAMPLDEFINYYKRAHVSEKGNGGAVPD